MSIRTLLKKVTIIPKGYSPKLKGSICNIPVSVVNRIRPAESSGLIVFKLKRIE